jgi:hypothetical protein
MASAASVARVFGASRARGLDARVAARRARAAKRSVTTVRARAPSRANERNITKPRIQPFSSVRPSDATREPAPLTPFFRLPTFFLLLLAPQTRAMNSDDVDEPETFVVPPDAFVDATTGESMTPERKAGVALGNLFTMAATRVILDQFTGTRHRSPVYYKMVDFLNENPLRNGNEWLAKLMREPDNDLRITAMRIIETRRVFADTEFNWDVVEAVTKEEIAGDTLEMTKSYLTESLTAD